MNRFEYYTQNIDKLIEFLYFICGKAVTHGMTNCTGPYSEGRMPKEIFIKRFQEYLKEPIN